MTILYIRVVREYLLEGQKMKHTRVVTSKNKQSVLDASIKRKQEKISLWKDDKNIWRAAHGPNHVPYYAIEIEHIK